MKKIISIITITVVGIALIISGIYLVDKNIVNIFDKKETKTNTEKENNNQDETYNQTIKFSEIDVENLKNATDKKEILLSGKKAVLERVVSVHEDGNYAIAYKLDDKKLEYGPYYDDIIYVINDILIFIGNEKSDEPVINPSLNIVMLDKNGDVLKTITEFSLEEMHISPFDTHALTINKNKIIVGGLRYSHGYDFTYNNTYYSLCDIDEQKTNNITSDYIMEADFELEYLGNNLFSNLKIIEDSIITLGQLQEKYC